MKSAYSEHHSRFGRGSRRGGVMVLVALMLVALLGMCALAIDLAYLMEIRTALQNVADTTALASVTALSAPVEDPISEAYDRARDFARRNEVLGEGYVLGDASIRFGEWDTDSQRFIETGRNWNSVRVELHHTASGSGGDSPLFFAPVLGKDSVDINVVAIATFGPRSMVLSLDRSGSMADDTVGGGPQQPLTDVKNRAREFVDTLFDNNIVGDYLGLVTYDELARRDVEMDDLILNLSPVRDAIGAMQIEYDPVPPQWACTNIGHAMQQSRFMLDELEASGRSSGVRTAVLLSDGRTNTRIPPSNGSASGSYRPCNGGGAARNEVIQEAGRYRDDGIILYTISFGTGADLNLMEYIAEQTGGEHFLAENAEALEHVFQAVSDRIPAILVQ